MANSNEPDDGIVGRYNDIVCGYYDEDHKVGAREVHYPNHEVAAQPLFSCGYHDCNGVALLGDNFFGLSHYDLDASNPKPEVYLNDMIEQMIEHGEDFVAVPFGGLEEHLDMNLEILENWGIEVVGEYHDHYHNGENADGKNVVVLPSQKKSF